MSYQDNESSRYTFLFLINNISWDKLFKKVYRLNLREIKKIKKDTKDYKNLKYLVFKNGNRYQGNIGICLMGLNLLPGIKYQYFTNNTSILLSQRFLPEHFLYWTSIYDKYGNRRALSRTTKINNLDSIHICKIIKEFKYKTIFHRLPRYYLEAFNNVLIKRHTKFGAWILKNLIKNMNDFWYRNSMDLLYKIVK